MSLMSDILTSVVNAIGADIKAIFAKFDATGKLLKDNLPTLNKSDVGLDNVDNTADKDKVVAKAVRLQRPFTLTLGNVLQGYVTIDGYNNVTMLNGNISPSKAFERLFSSGYEDNTSSPDLYNAGERARYYTKPSSGHYNEIAYLGSITSLGMANSVVMQTLFKPTYSGGSLNPFSGMFVRQRTIASGVSNSAASYKWLPLSTNVYTYETTTTEPPNVYVGSDGVLKRSTNPPKSTVILEGTIGTADNGYQTNISHGLDVNRIKSVTAKINISTDANIPMYVQENTLSGIEAGIIGYINYFTVGFNSHFVTLTAHRNATNTHGKPVTIFIETI